MYCALLRPAARRDAPRPGDPRRLGRRMSGLAGALLRRGSLIVRIGSLTAHPEMIAEALLPAYGHRRFGIDPSVGGLSEHD